MNYFWGNFFEYCKERRNASIFIGTLAVFFGLLVAGVIIYQVADGYNLLQYWPFALLGFGLFLSVLVVNGIRQARSRRLNRYKSSPLSRDELRKARSKLVGTKK
jgi:predicted tellurium resistance membrane protein TerC